MKFAFLKTCLICSCFAISLSAQDTIKEGQSPYLKLTKYPRKITIKSITSADKQIGALYLLKDTSILLSSSLAKEDYLNGKYEIAELYIENISMISYKSARGLMVGTLIGVGVGVLISAIDMAVNNYSWNAFNTLSTSILAVTGGGIGAVVGTKIKIRINGSVKNYNLQKERLGRYTIKYPGAPTY